MSAHAEESGAVEVLTRWRANATARFGRQPGDWDDGPVGHLAAAAATGELVAATAGAFGRSRSLSGWTLGELLDDLEDLFVAAFQLSDAARWAAVRAATEGWSEQVIAATLTSPYRDPLTGLPTVGYLIVEAEPLYWPDRSPSAATTHSLVFLRLRDRHGLARMQLFVQLAERAAACFGGHCAVAALDSHCVVVLISNEAEHYARALELADTDDVDVTLEPVPATIRQLESRLAAFSCA